MIIKRLEWSQFFIFHIFWGSTTCIIYFPFKYSKNENARHIALGHERRNLGIEITKAKSKKPFISYAVGLLKFVMAHPSSHTCSSTNEALSSNKSSCSSPFRTTCTSPTASSSSSPPDPSTRLPSNISCCR